MKIRMKQKMNEKLIEEYLKCKKDVIRFADKHIYVNQPHGMEKIKLDYSQKKILKKFNKDHNLCILASRQTGVTTANKILIAHTLIFNTNCTIGVISRNKQYIEDINFMLDYVPPEFVPKYIMKTKNRIDLANGCRLVQTYNPNPHVSFLGMSLNILVIEDAAYINKLEELTINLYPALAKVQDVSKKLNKPYGIIMSSSPPIADRNNYYLRIWKQSKKGKTFYTPIKVHWRNICRLREDKTWYNDIRKCLQNKKILDREINLKGL